MIITFTHGDVNALSAYLANCAKLLKELPGSQELPDIDANVDFAVLAAKLQQSFNVDAICFRAYDSVITGDNTREQRLEIEFTEEAARRLFGISEKCASMFVDIGIAAYPLIRLFNKGMDVINSEAQSFAAWVTKQP